MTPATRTLAEGFWARMWLREPASTSNGGLTDDMYMWLWWFCVAWFVFLMALMVFWVIKYRRRPGRIAPRSAAHNTPLEVAWTVIPTLMLVFIFFKGFHGYMDQMVAPGDAVELNVTGMKWSWQVVYPNGAETNETTKLGTGDVPVFYVPAERAIRLRMSSKDVMHAFWVPDFRVKQDIFPNRYTTLWFKPNALDPAHPRVRPSRIPEPGSKDAKDNPGLIALNGALYHDHWLFCAEYCGDEHSQMWAVVRVVPEDAYNRWLTAVGTPGDPVTLGKQIWKTKCSSCHTVDGGKNTGPTWKDLFGSDEELTDGARVHVDENYILESIMEPGRKITKGYETQLMTSFQGVLNQNQVEGVIAYMKTLSVHYTPPAGTPPADETTPAPTAPPATPPG